MKEGDIAYQFSQNRKTWVMQYPPNSLVVSDMIVCKWRVKGIKNKPTIQYTFDNPKGKLKQ